MPVARPEDKLDINTTTSPDTTAIESDDELYDELDYTTVYTLLNEFRLRGPNHAYALLEYKLGAGRRRSQTNYWQYVRDAVDGTGGYANGAYLYSYRLETNASGLPTQKLLDRREQADYDNFAKDVCMAAWDQIVQSKDLIIRKSTQDSINAFWKNVDGRGTAIMDFLEFVFKQARMYGTAYVFMDRPFGPIANVVEDAAAVNAPYLYTVPSQNVVQWSFDANDDINGVVIVEPSDQYYNNNTQNDGFANPHGPHNLRIWTRDAWALFKAVERTITDAQGKTTTEIDYDLKDGGTNPIGDIPMVAFFNEDPGPRKLLGVSEMMDVARVSQTVFNIDSEAREIERKCALFLAMPVRDAKEFDSKTVEVGTDSMMVYDGEAGQPHWVSPDLHILDKLAHKRQEKIEEAYAMAHLRVLVGNIQTKSGFHAEVEFQKTERRIARHAAQLEVGEVRVAALFFKYMGIVDNKDGTLYEITYPREYGVRDIEKLLERTQVILGLQLGEAVDRVTLEQFFKVLYSRKSQAEIDALVNGAVTELKTARAALASAGASASPAGGSNLTSTQRLQQLLAKASSANATADLKTA